MSASIDFKIDQKKVPVHKIKGTAARLTARLPAPVHLAIAKILGHQNHFPELDSHLLVLLAVQKKLGKGGLLDKGYIQGRNDFRSEMLSIVDTPTPVGKVRNFSIPGRTSSIKVRHYIPASKLDLGDPLQPMLVFFHGGGFIVGDLDTHDEPCRLLCKYANIHVLSVEYRLAPEHPAPAAVEDCLDALRWVNQHAITIGVDPHRIAVGGESAGGNLAAVVSQYMINHPYVPFAQLLIYPGLDCNNDNDRYPSRVTYGQDFFVRDTDINKIEEWYVHTSNISAMDPILSPIHGDVKGVAPTMMVVVEHDVVRDENVIYEDKLRAAGVYCESLFIEKQVHGFINFTSINRSAYRAMVEVATAFGNMMHHPDIIKND